MRRLATVQRIAEIAPIEGADAIERARINGWWVVVKKQEFKVDDLIVYLEIDSWVPTELAPFLSKGQEPRVYDGVKGERLRTVKLRGQVSQGLVLPLSVLGKDVTAEEDTDVTDTLGIKKYEPPIPAHLAGVVAGPWPTRVPKTDEERVQNLSSSIPTLRTMQFEVTEKLDGSSCTMAIVDDKFVVCSRNLNLAETEENTFWKMSRKYSVEDAMRNLHLNNFAIQGEVVGEGIQGNRYAVKGQEFFVFNMFDVERQAVVSPEDRVRLCGELNLKHVPILGTYDLQVICDGLGIDPVSSILKFAEGKSTINGSREREGVVFKQIGGEEHFKAISNIFLQEGGN